MENDFSNVKVNDMAFHVRYGWNIVSATPKTNNSYFEITFTDNLGSFTIKFTRTGRMDESDLNPCVFWNEVKIVAPPKPKRKVEKVIEGWINIYLNDTTDIDNLFVTVCGLYKSRNLADLHTHTYTKQRLGDAYHLLHLYTVEE